MAEDRIPECLEAVVARSYLRRPASIAVALKVWIIPEIDSSIASPDRPLASADLGVRPAGGTAGSGKARTRGLSQGSDDRGTSDPQSRSCSIRRPACPAIRLMEKDCRGSTHLLNPVIG